MQVTAPLEIGRMAPDFALQGPGGQIITLSEYRGSRNVVLVFFPLAFSPVCSHQLPAIQRELARFESLGAVVLGISVDSHYTNTAFAERLRLTFPLLADFKRETSAAYGVLIAASGHSERALFVVDREGRLAYRDQSPSVMDPTQIPSFEPVLARLTDLA
jgi:peroxiredoxin